ncbi:MAG: hypothetical protein R3A79_21200 [Nannocystaceae bacterium]
MAVNRASAGYGGAIEAEYCSDETVAAICGALRSHGARVEAEEVDADFFARCGAIARRHDVVFNVSEGLSRSASRKALVAAAMDHLGVAYTGSGAAATLLAQDKEMTRRYLGGAVPQPAWTVARGDDPPLPERLAFPVIVKPASHGSSVGIEQGCVVSNRADLRAALARLRARVSGEALVESFLGGTEYVAAILGDVVLPALAWDWREYPGAPLLLDEAMEAAGTYAQRGEVIRDLDLHRRLARAAIRAHVGLGLGDYSRVDLRADAAGEPHLLEVNHCPGLRPAGSLLPREAAAAGISYGDLVASIVWLAVRREKARRPRSWLAGVELAPYEAAWRRAREETTTVAMEVDGRMYRLVQPRVRARPFGAAAAHK